MATNYSQPGDVLTLTAPYAVSSGGGMLVGSIFAVALAAAASSASVQGQTNGVWQLSKAGSQAWTVGALIYWDNTNKVCTTSSSGNKLIGVATAAVGSGAGETLGFVRLNGAFVS